MKLSEALEYATDTACFLTGEVIEESGRVYRDYFGNVPAFLVADENTHRAAGVEVERAFGKAGVRLLDPVLFPGFPVLSCDYTISRQLCADIRSRGAIPVAVGSGTINDLVKVAAFEADLMYMNIATAASVDGYSAPGASMIRNGFKNSIYCRAPKVVIADTRVIKSAPPSMTSSGYADLAGKYTAGADWIIADMIGSEPVDQIAWRMVHEDLDSWLADPEGIPLRRGEAVEKLFLGLTMTGLAMQYLRKSRPASGLEHLMSHIWEMSALTHEGKAVSHGSKVSIGSLAATALIECIFRYEPGDFAATARGGWTSIKSQEKNIRARFDDRLLPAVLAEYRAKHVPRRVHERRVSDVAARWDAIRRNVLAQLPPYGELKRRLSTAGAPVVPEEIGMTRETVADTFLAASYIRNRYTSVDLAIDLGILEGCVEEILKSDTYLR